MVHLNVLHAWRPLLCAVLGAAGLMAQALTPTPVPPPTPAPKLTLAASLASPQPVNTPILLTATLNPLPATTVLYKFRLAVATNTGATIWQDLTGYQASNTYTWKPEKPGSYVLGVVTQTANTLGGLSASLPYTIKEAAQPSSVSLATSPASPQALGTPVTLIARAVGGTKVEFRFCAALSTSSASPVVNWIELAPYSATATCVWKPTTAGSYQLMAQARNAGTAPTAPASATITYQIASPTGIAITPKTVTLPVGGKQSFATTVSGLSSTAVKWSVQETSGGSIDASGNYTAPTTAGVYHVVATSVADPTKSATAEIHTVDGSGGLQLIAANAIDERNPISHSGIELINDTIPSWTNPFLFGELGAKPAATNVINVTVYGVLIKGTWTATANPLNVNGQVTITGTITGSPNTALNGTTLNGTLTGAVTNGSGTITYVGDLTPPPPPPGPTMQPTPAPPTYHFDIKKTVSIAGSGASIHTVASETVNGSVVFTRDVTWSVDPLAATPRPCSGTGTLSISRPAEVQSKLNAKLNALTFVRAANTATGAIGVIWQSGSLTLTDNLGFTVTLTAQPDGTLAGPVLNSQGITVAMMSVKNLTITIVRK